MNYVVIMAGGVGSRFWPSSRTRFPKQFLDVLGIGRSLLQMTYDRFCKIVSQTHILIVTNGLYRDLVAEQLPELPADNILCEPSRNNTAPCVAYALLRLRAMDPQAAFVVAPSDHLILKEADFLQRIQQGLDFVSQTPALLTLGIQPSRPDTGYGYIRFAAGGDAQRPAKVLQFTEKPDAERAAQFVASGDYLWNAGIFVWSVPTLLAAFEQHAPDIYALLAGSDCYGTTDEAAFIAQQYPQTPDISIDYAILEKADNVYTLPADIGWSDLGTWASLYEELEHDAQANAVIQNGSADKVWCLDSRNCLVRVPQGKMVIIKDMQDYIIVDEHNALLIYPKNKEQEIKQVVKEVGKRFGEEML